MALMNTLTAWLGDLQKDPRGTLVKAVGAVTLFFLGLIPGARLLRRILLKFALKSAFEGKDKFSLLLLKTFGGKHPPTLEFQEVLPQLPVPSLKSSLKKWLESVKPLVSAQDYEEAERAAQELETSEQGKALQKILQKRAREKDNWLTDWWVEFAYLRQRVPLPTNVSFYSTDTYDNMYGDCYTRDQVKRCVDLMCTQTDFYQLVEQQRFKPQRIGGVLPVCMEGFYSVYGTTRVPGETIDQLVVHKVPKNGDAHVIVMIGSMIFKVPVIIGGKRVPKGSLQQAVTNALSQANSAGKTKWGEGWFSQPNVSLLTSRNRSDWAKQHQEIIESSGVNKSNMQCIEQALFAMVLSDKATECPKSNRSLAWEAFCGDGSRIWYDKNFSIIIFADARAAWHYEHTYADAPVPGMACEYALIQANPRSQQYSCSEYKVAGTPSYDGPITAQLLQWDAEKVPKLAAYIAEARREFDHLTSDLALNSLYVYDFGTDHIKKLKVSPDAFCQAVLQVAALRYFGRHVLTYESASLRAFKRGRTETIRSATAEMTAFARALVTGEHKTPEGKEKVQQMLRQASAKHSGNSKDSAQGKGFDRHLLGLKLAALTTGQDLPAIFKTKAYNLEYELATSQSPIVQEHVRAPTKMMTQGGGFGPTTNPGIGCSYHPQKEVLYFNISARSPNARQDQDKFQKYVEAAIQETRALFEP